MDKDIYQIKIKLLHSSPPIWRRILVPSKTKMPNIHKIIQTAMGWENAHLHSFRKGTEVYSPHTLYDDFGIDYKNIKLSDLLVIEKNKLLYEYDFGDGWMHEILLEKILPIDPLLKYPVCIAGKLNCPPEDCGGVYQYNHLVALSKASQKEEKTDVNKEDNVEDNDEEYDDFIEWLDEDFRPEFFDIDAVNKYLLMRNYGCSTFGPF